MFRFTWRSLVAKRLRLMGTALAIVLGVAFTVGTLILTDTMSRSIHSAVDTVAEGVDVMVRGEATTTLGSMTMHGLVPASAVTQVRAVDGVRHAEPYWQGAATVLDRSGKILDIPQSTGISWVPDRELSMFRLSEGSAPSRGEVVLGELAATKADVRPGDTVRVVTTGGPEQFRVSGIGELTGNASFGPVAFVLFEQADAASRLGPPGKVNAVLVSGEAGTDAKALAAGISAAVPAVDAITGAEMASEQKGDVDEGLSLLQTAMLVFAGIALFVGCFTIANTFSITLAQRTRELALVRALGASRRQIVRSVVLEAAILGLLASVVGLVVGMGVAKALFAFLGNGVLSVPEGPLVVAPSTLVLGMIVGVGVTVVAAFLPARRAARVAPVAAMRQSAIEDTAPSRGRVVVGGVLTVVSVLLLVVGITRDEPGQTGLGVAAALGAVLVLGPVLVTPLTRVLALPLRMRGLAGRLAASNAARNPRRSAATASALLVGVALVSGASMFAATAKDNLSGDVERTLGSQLVLRPLGAAPGVPASLTEQLTSRPGLTAV